MPRACPILCLQRSSQPPAAPPEPPRSLCLLWLGPHASARAPPSLESPLGSLPQDRFWRPRVAVPPRTCCASGKVPDALVAYCCCDELLQTQRLACTQLSHSPVVRKSETGLAGLKLKASAGPPSFLEAARRIRFLSLCRFRKPPAAPGWQPLRPPASPVAAGRVLLTLRLSALLCLPLPRGRTTWPRWAPRR